MRLLTALARPMLASIFITGGLDAARAPGGRAKAAAKIGLPESDLLVRANGAAMVVGGAALALGYKPRRAALLLAGTLVPTTYAGHSFWGETDAAAKQTQQIHFFKNLSMLGGLLVVAGDPPPTKVPRSARKAGKQVTKAAATAARETEKAQDKVGRSSRRKAEKIEAKAAKHAAKIEAKAVAKAEAKARAKAAAQLAKAAKDTAVAHQAA